MNLQTQKLVWQQKYLCVAQSTQLLWVWILKPSELDEPVKQEKDTALPRDTTALTTFRLRTRLLNSPEHVALSFFKKDWWHLTGLSLNLHIGFSYSNTHVLFPSRLATIPSASFRGIDPIIHIYITPEWILGQTLQLISQLHSKQQFLRINWT